MIDDFKIRGQQSPCMVKRIGKNRYRIFDGNYRYLAALATDRPYLVCFIIGESGPIQNIEIGQITPRDEMR